MLKKKSLRVNRFYQSSRQIDRQIDGIQIARQKGILLDRYYLADMKNDQVNRCNKKINKMDRKMGQIDRQIDGQIYIQLEDRWIDGYR